VAASHQVNALAFRPLLFTFGRFALSAWLFALSSALLLDSHRSRIKNMSVENVPSRVLYQDLDTSFVNLWGLLGYLSRQSFVGRVHVELSDYSADVFLDGADTPLVHEIDNVAGTDVVEEAALHRLVLRVRESMGKITVYEGADEAVAPQPQAVASSISPAATPESTRSSDEKDGDAGAETTGLHEATPTADEHQIIKLSGALIAAVEHAATSQGANFAGLFRDARVALGDDYTFLDPMSGSFHYENSSVTVEGGDVPQGFVTGLSEGLRRVVDQMATGERPRKTRERVALELARVARKNGEVVSASGFKDQLDRIAGTKVI
jgi:hypothetical protein